MTGHMTDHMTGHMTGLQDMYIHIIVVMQFYIYNYIMSNTMYIHLYMFLMRDEKERRKKQARSNKQTRQSNTAHPRQSLFRAASGGTRTHDTLFSRQSALPAELGSSAGWAQISHLIVHLMNMLTCTCTWHMSYLQLPCIHITSCCPDMRLFI